MRRDSNSRQNSNCALANFTKRSECTPEQENRGTRSIKSKDSNVIKKKKKNENRSPVRDDNPWRGSKEEIR